MIRITLKPSASPPAWKHLYSLCFHQFTTCRNADLMDARFYLRENKGMHCWGKVKEWRWMKIERERREVNRKKVITLPQLSIFHQASLLMQACQRSTVKRNTLASFWHRPSNGAASSHWGGKMADIPATHIHTPHTPSKFTVMSEAMDRRTGPVLECVFSAWLGLYTLSLWTSCGGNLLLSPPFSLPCSSFHPLSLTSSSLVLDIGSMYRFWLSKPKSHSCTISSFYISVFIFLSFTLAVFFLLPELIEESHAVAEAWETDDGGCDVFLPPVRLFGKESCWGGELNVLRNESWFLSCVCLVLVLGKILLCSDTLLSLE